VKHLVARMLGLLVAIAVPIGCTHQIDGAAAVGPRVVDRAYFFAGEVPVYGQSVSPTTSPRWPICARCAASTRVVC
jgi:hypothetical protein